MNMSDLRPGTVVATGIPWTPFYHVGLIGDTMAGGMPTIISNSQRCGGVAEEPLVTFGDTTAIRILGYWSELSPAEVLYRARQHFGAKWHLTDWNCEHFVRAAHGIKAESPQLRVGLTLLAVALIIAGIKLARSR